MLEAPLTYVIGHRNPDSDSVLSAIGYAALLRASHPERRFIAAAAGPVTAQTKFVLDRFGVPCPEVVHDLTPKAGSFRRERLVTIRETDSIASALELYARHQFKAIPAVDDNGVCVGVLALADVCSSFLRPRLETDLRAVTTTGAALARAVRGRFVGNNRAVALKRRKLFVPAVSDAVFLNVVAKRLSAEDWRDGIFVIGHRPNLLRVLLQNGAGVVIVSKAGRFSPGETHAGENDENDDADTDADDADVDIADLGGVGEISTGSTDSTDSPASDVLRLAESSDVEAGGSFGAGFLTDDLAALLATGASAVIATPLAVVSATLLAKQSTPVAEYVDRDRALLVTEGAKLSEVRTRLATAKHSHAVCVVDRFGRPIGIVTRMDLLEARLVDVVLVDHNETSQRVEGVDGAGVRVVEVVDHHRLGAMATPQTIRLTTRPVGSTCTIVAALFLERFSTVSAAISSVSTVLTPQLAGLLLSGILCDTLILRSPTTTRVDEAIATRLEQVAGLKRDELGTAIFQAASPLVGTPDVRALILADHKIYPIDGTDVRIGVAQIEITSMATLTSDLLGRLLKHLEDIADAQKLWVVALLVTDVMAADSLLLCHGPQTLPGALGYPLFEDYDLVFELRGVVSRKKQLLPHLLRVLPTLLQ